jgi:DNA ligase-1
MNRFAALIDRLAYEPRRNAKIAILAAYLRATPDPDRGYALAAMTGALSFANAKPALVRGLIAERTDPLLFALSYDFVGDLSETVALMWPAPGGSAVDARGGAAAKSGDAETPLSLGVVITQLASAGKSELPRLLAAWLDVLDATGRWALLKLITGAMRIGVSARLAHVAAAELSGGAADADAVAEVWHGADPPYLDLFAWLEGRASRPQPADAARFRPAMLAHALDETDLAGLEPADFVAEWKWDGIRVQAVVAPNGRGGLVRRLFSRSGEDISAAFPDIVERLTVTMAVDGELLVRRDGRIGSFNELQQRLNRKSVTARLIAAYPVHIRAYDLLDDTGADLRGLAFELRRARLAELLAKQPHLPMDLSPLVSFDSWEALAAARRNPAAAGAGDDADAVEGLMLKARASPYLAGRPRGHWWKWKRAPHTIDCVLMYAQRGHGKRASFYSDYTFGVWRPAAAGRELVPVGKAYFGFTDEELKRIDRFVRARTVNRFGPVREIVHTEAEGLVLEIAFEGLQASTRHKSGVAMRFPRIARIRWDKKPGEADELAVLRQFIPAGG